MCEPEALAALVDATREAHSAIKALRQAERDARQAAREVDDEARRTVEQRVETIVNEVLQDFQTQLDRRLVEGDKSIQHRFDEVLAELQRLRMGQPPTPGLSVPRKRSRR